MHPPSEISPSLDSLTRRRVDSFPKVSVLALFAMPLLALLSMPFWMWYIDRQVRSSEIYAPDPGQHGGLALVALLIMTGTIGAFAGLVLAKVAGGRNEPRRWIRILAWIVNGLGAALGTCILVSFVLIRIK